MAHYTKEQPKGFTQAFQYLSVSANSIFRRKVHNNQRSNIKSRMESANDYIKPIISNSSPVKSKTYEKKIVSSYDMRFYEDSPYSPYDASSLNDLSRSNSDITLSSSISTISDKTDDYQTPTPSTSSCALMTSSVPHNNASCTTPDKNAFIKAETDNTPWRLDFINEGQINTNYFFMDRDDNDSVSAGTYSERDLHGFKRPTQWIKIQHLHQFDKYYTPIVNKQHQDWEKLLLNHKNQWPPLNLELKKCARNGIPNNLRGPVWLYYSGAKSKIEANPELYESLVNTAYSMGDQNEYAEIIQRDLHRTFPDNSEFSCTVRQSNGSLLMMPETNSKLQSLRRILLAFSIHSPHIGYCQSLNYLAGFFLLFVDNEEEAFWMLVTTVHEYFPENMYDVTMEGANVDQAVLMMFVYEKMPGIWNKMTGGKCFWENERTDGLPPITLVTCHWFLTLFINILPVETVLRIWDCFFIEGYHILLRVALSLIKMNEERIWTLQDPIEIFQILQNMPRRLIDCHRFINYVFSPDNLFLDVDMEQIEFRRRTYREQRRQRRQQSV